MRSENICSGGVCQCLLMWSGRTHTHTHTGHSGTQRTPPTPSTAASVSISLLTLESYSFLQQEKGKLRSFAEVYKRSERFRDALLLLVLFKQSNIRRVLPSILSRVVLGRYYSNSTRRRFVTAKR